MKRFIQAIALLTATIALTACGFQLRGQYNFDFETIELRGMENSEMNRNMDLQLQILNLKVNPQEGAPLKLNLISELRDRSIVTFSATGRAREVRVTYELMYSVTDKNGDFLIATNQLSQRRELTYTDDQILGKEGEENQLYTEMQRDIARQITGRLSALKLSPK
ncbi:LPS-assembly lipoprotein LptE [Limnobacter sp.]|uniref:LPS-assembly lipoprotein LptE n=1 Tax=Limnobacter sp. TaxID=2003368 RepID=UPI002FE1F7EA